MWLPTEDFEYFALPVTARRESAQSVKIAPGGAEDDATQRLGHEAHLSDLKFNEL
jgi:hypothetical protein